MSEEDEELPANSEELQQAIKDWLTKKRTAAGKVKQVLGLLNHERLGAGAEKYDDPVWRKDGPPSMYRAHWRHQACKILGIKEADIPEAVVDALKAYLWPTALDTTRGDRNAWLVKVPKFVSRVFHEAAAASKQAMADDDDMDTDTKEEDEPAIGTVRVFVDPFQEDKTKHMTHAIMELTGKEANGVPKQYILANQPSDMPMRVFSDVREGTTSGQADITLEAKVDLKLDMRPTSIDDVDYHRVSKDRMIQAQTKTRVTQSSSEMRFAPLPKARNLIRFTDAASNKKEKKERMEKKALENVLFGLFERQPYWSLKQLILETKQPVDWLKTNLGEIALLTRRGPNMGLWGA